MTNKYRIDYLLYCLGIYPFEQCQDYQWHQHHAEHDQTDNQGFDKLLKVMIYRK